MAAPGLASDHFASVGVVGISGALMAGWKRRAGNMAKESSFQPLKEFVLVLFRAKYSKTRALRSIFPGIYVLMCGFSQRPMKLPPLLIGALCALFTTHGYGQQAVPHAPAIPREVTGVINTYPGGAGTTAVPAFTRPHMPGFRVTADGRVGIMVEGGGSMGSTPAFTLFMPEKMTVPFLLNAPGSYTMTSTVMTRLNVVNTHAPSPLDTRDYTDGVKGVSHACLWDDGNNPQVVAGEDVYNIKVVVTSNSGTSPDNRVQIFSTPIKITVSNPKTTSASIRLIEKTGPSIAGPAFTFQGSGFEPVIAGDGRLLMVRVGSPSLPWNNPNTGAAMPAHGCDILYSYYTTGASADAAQWTNLIPITFAPSDNRINTKFGFAMFPFRDPEGTLIPPGEDLGASYPWIDRDAKNLFVETVFDKLHFNANGTWNNGRYPQTAVPGETADYAQGEDGGKHQGISMLGLWTHGKMVMIDNLNNATDYAVGQGDVAGGAGPQHRMVSLYTPNSGPLGTETGWLMLGYGRATKKMPLGENDNGNIIDSLEHLLNYRKEAFPLTRRDVVWPLSNGQQADEVAFDDYLEQDAFIIANMTGLVTFPSTAGSSTGQNSLKHHSGWKSTNTFGDPVKLQNAATPVASRWIVPKHGLVVGNGRLEPAASGGVHGKGFSMNGGIGLEFTVDPQPQPVATKDWYIGIFVDSRFANDTTERRLITFPDNTSVALYGRSQVLYRNASDVVIHRITIPAPIAGTHMLDDLLPEKGWAHLAFQVLKEGTQVDFHLNGIIFNRFEDPYQVLFQMTDGTPTARKLTLGKVASKADSGFAGWIDDFKVFAHAVDYETACNHANGSLIGLPTAYTAEWKTKFADRYPAWAHTEITNFLKNNGEVTYPKYANFYNLRADNAAHRDNTPAGTVSLRTSVHFPEGPLFFNRPRPDSVSNAFCLTCHHVDGKGGLDLAALDLDTSWNASVDPRRQPMQPPAKLFGRIPIGLVNNTATPMPTVLTDLPAGGKSVDEWMLPSFNNSATVQSITVVDANTGKDLMTLTANAVVDPAKLGSTNLTFRANLDRAQGNVTLQYDSTTPNVRTIPPYTAFGPDSNPYLGATLTPGAHTIKATPQFGTLSQLSFTVAGNATRVVADYRDDYKTHSPQGGWSYLWNGGGDIASPANYRTMNWNGGRYTPNGFAAYPDNSVTVAPYVSLNSTGGHPGRGVNQSAVTDRYAIAAYTVKKAGRYGVTNGFVAVGSAASNGAKVVIYTELNGTTASLKYTGTVAPASTLTLSQNVGFLNPGDTIYVGVGPNLNDGSDSFTQDFSIVYNETVDPI